MKKGKEGDEPSAHMINCESEPAVKSKVEKEWDPERATGRVG